ncbi:MAG: acetyl-CoA carboxylase biotin carboxyl carrier protein [Rhodospirillales bacterium]|nr:acetyl-CoA carboxylase biotin carboxyl carrier protein [Rhodospirillales bacterium]
MTHEKKSFGPEIEVVRQLAGVLVDAGLTEIEYDTGGWRVRVVKAPAPVMATTVAVPSAAPSVAPAPSAPAGDAAAPREGDSLADHPGILASPMVGVVYTAADPAAPPFIKVGDVVAVGDTVLLIEAMKVFNPIKAHRSGRIERIFVTSGMPVEYGEPLLLIV